MRQTVGLVLVAALIAATVPVAAAGSPPSARGDPSAAIVRTAPAAGSLPAGMATVIVTMKAQADLGSVRGNNPAARQAALIRTLQAFALASQWQLVAWLRAREADGGAARHSSFWVFNGLSVTATPAVIADLAGRADVGSVTPDEVPIVPAGIEVTSTSGGVSAASSNPTEPNIASVNAPALWALGYTGQGVVVANLDSGVDVKHPDLTGRWRGGANS